MASPFANIPITSLADQNLFTPPPFSSPLGEQLHVGDRVIPGIKLRGHWQQQAGVEVNEKIRIRVMQG